MERWLFKVLSETVMPYTFVRTRDIKTFESVMNCIVARGIFCNPEGREEKEVPVLLAYRFLVRPMSIGMVQKDFSFYMWKQNNRVITMNIDLKGLLVKKWTGSS